MRKSRSFALHTVHVPVRTSPYDVIVGRQMLHHLGPTLRSLKLGRDIVIVTDARVGALYLEKLQRHLDRRGFRPFPVVLREGEAQKSLNVASKVYTRMLRRGVGRNGSVLALGGGVIGDLAGFVASTYQRGIALVHVPTTLLAQVDSSIGGKVGVNHELGKNMIGSFYQPRLVWSDVSYLRTLPPREYASGTGEVIKYGVIRDGRLFRWLEQNIEMVVRGDASALLHVQARCAAIKARVCGQDEREKGIRIILNFGHTVGHALESAGKYRTLKHGEAVLLGMKAESWLAKELGMLSDSSYRRISGLIERVPVPRSRRSLRLASVMNAMTRDKKNRLGRKRFVLPTRIGSVSVIEGIDETLVRASVREIL